MRVLGVALFAINFEQVFLKSGREPSGPRGSDPLRFQRRSAITRELDAFGSGRLAHSLVPHPRQRPCIPRPTFLVQHTVTHRLERQVADCVDTVNPARAQHDLKNRHVACTIMSLH